MGQYNVDGKLSYGKMAPGEEVEFCQMVIECFNEFVAQGYSHDGIEEFLKYVNPDSMRDRLAHGNFVFVALRRNTVVGVIEIRTSNHIALLFVKKRYHKRGIAKKLLELSIERCKMAVADLKMIDVNSSPYAVRIYERLGFIKTDVEQLVNGIRFMPMALSLN